MDEFPKMYREVISGAVRDMGYGGPGSIRDVKSWMKRDPFLVVCELARWDEGWVRNLLESIDSLSGPVRRPITKECLEMLRTVIRITDVSDTHEAWAWRGQSNSAPVSEEMSMKFNGKSHGDAGRRSVKMHSRRLSRKDV